MIRIHTSSRYKVKRKRIISLAQKFMDKHGVGSDLVNIVFVGKRKMRSIASEYGHGNVAKPVLSFPIRDEVSEEEATTLLGEIIICYPQAVLLAAEKDKSVDKTIDQLVEHGISNLVY